MMIEPDQTQGIFDLTTRRKLLDAEADNVRLREDLARMAKVIAAHGTVLTTGKITKHSTERCKFHVSIVVDEDAPRVECAHCKTELDPHTVLLEIARKERHCVQWSKMHKDAQEKLLREIEALKRQKANLRAAVRKLGGTPIESWEIPTPAREQTP